IAEHELAINKPDSVGQLLHLTPVIVMHACGNKVTYLDHNAQLLFQLAGETPLWSFLRLDLAPRKLPGTPEDATNGAAHEQDRAVLLEDRRRHPRPRRVRCVRHCACSIPPIHIVHLVVRSVVGEMLPSNVVSWGDSERPDPRSLHLDDAQIFADP